MTTKITFEVSVEVGQTYAQPLQEFLDHDLPAMQLYIKLVLEERLNNTPYKNNAVVEKFNVKIK